MLEMILNLLFYQGAKENAANTTAVAWELTILNACTPLTNL